MLDLKFVIQNEKTVKSKLKTRGFATEVLDQILVLARKRSQLMTQMQELESQKNQYSREVSNLKRNQQDATSVLKKVHFVKEKMGKIRESHDQTIKVINNLLLQVPNVPADETPLGNSEEDNTLIKEHKFLGRGKVKGVVPHHEIAQSLDIVDFERTAKIAGTRFWTYKKQGAQLLRALVSFMVETNVQRGYEEITPPVIVNSASLLGTGHLPKFKNDLFRIANSDKWLIPTAEVPLTSFFAREILDLKKPVKLTSFTNCFRSEAGSGGKDTRGLIRAHQFYKVELVKIVTHKDLDLEFTKTLEDAKFLLAKLELPFQEVQLCTGDLGFAAAKTVDLEVWIPSENKYREISSVSSFSDFQCRRAHIRYKNEENHKNVPACSINGSALAIDRLIAAILENYQNEDGSITIPKVLQKYMNQSFIN